jgi:hypothetical protein
MYLHLPACLSVYFFLSLFSHVCSKWHRINLVHIYIGSTQVIIGVYLMALMCAAFWDADEFLQMFFGVAKDEKAKLQGNSFAQTAVAFGMHAYADIANGWEQMQVANEINDPTAKLTPMPKVVSLWNSVRFLISFVWLLSLVDGLYALYGANFPSQSPRNTMVLLAVLAFDAVVLRPVAVYCQRARDDAIPPVAHSESSEWTGFSLLQKVCRSVFYYEAVLSVRGSQTWWQWPRWVVKEE